MVSQVNPARVAESHLPATRKELAMSDVPRRRYFTIAGAGASHGIGFGYAKVVRAVNDMNKVQPGDVLVCEAMTPALTALLPLVSGIVADRGGILSNCAIIAREYGLPCVVQTVIGTDVIRDGMLLIVDGIRGLVCVDSSPTGGPWCGGRGESVESKVRLPPRGEKG